MRNSVTGHIKIGRSKNPKARRENIQGANSDPIELIAVYPGKADREKALHRGLRRYRLAGEWFRDSEIVRCVLEMEVGQSDPIPEEIKAEPKVSKRKSRARSAHGLPKTVMDLVDAIANTPPDRLMAIRASVDAAWERNGPIILEAFREARMGKI
jgi:hypothetical protein